jgi:hypothetical protein
MQPAAPQGAKYRILISCRHIQITVNPLRFLVDAFVNTFGITQPAPEAEARAGRYIALMLGAVLLVLGVAAWLLHGAFTR